MHYPDIIPSREPYNVEIVDKSNDIPYYICFRGLMALTHQIPKLLL